MPDITMMWANEMMVANDVATMTSGDRIGCERIAVLPLTIG